MTTLDLTVRATTFGKPPSDFAARVNEFTRRERVRRGARVFLPYFGVGCSLLIVPPHVLWLLLCTTLGFLIGRRRYKLEREFLSLTGTCPDCGKSEALDLPEVLPVIQRCKLCGAFLKLESV
jgi:hypothetical protein